MSVFAGQMAAGRLRTWWLAQSPVQRLYCAGFVSTAVWILFVLRKVGGVADAALFSAMTFFAAGVLLEVYRVIADRHSVPIVKVGLYLSTAVAAAVSAGASAVLIGSATGQDPNHFKWSLPILAPIAFVPVLGLAVMVTAALSLLPMMILMAAAPSTGWKGWVWPARMLGAAGVFAGAFWAVSTPTSTHLAKVARYAVYWFDMHPDASCSAVEGDRVVRLNDDLIILARPSTDGPRFARKACALKAEEAGLPAPGAGV